MEWRDSPHTTTIQGWLGTRRGWAIHRNAQKVTPRNSVLERAHRKSLWLWRQRSRYITSSPPIGQAWQSHKLFDDAPINTHSSSRSRPTRRGAIVEPLGNYMYRLQSQERCRPSSYSQAERSRSKSRSKSIRNHPLQRCTLTGCIPQGGEDNAARNEVRSHQKVAFSDHA
jgi:hypothetical protein